MSQTALAIWSWIVTQLPTAAVAVGVAYALFKYLGKAWLEDRFARQLKDHQAALDRQLKRSQADIDHAIHRAKKLYDREFDVMQEAWERANRCFQEGLNTAVDFHPKLDKLSDGDYEAYLRSATVLSDGQKAELRAVSQGKRTDAYRRAINIGRYNKFQEELGQFQTFILANSMYMRAEFEAMYDEIEKLTRITLYDFRVRIEGEQIGFKSVSELGNEGRPLLEKIKKLTRNRLWSSANLSTDERSSELRGEQVRGSTVH